MTARPLYTFDFGAGDKLEFKLDRERNFITSVKKGKYNVVFEWA